MILNLNLISVLIGQKEQYLRIDKLEFQKINRSNLTYLILLFDLNSSTTTYDWWKAKLQVAAIVQIVHLYLNTEAYGEGTNYLRGRSKMSTLYWRWH